MVSTDTAHRSQKGAAFLFLLAFGLVATGIGFAYAPHYSWQVTKIARQANAFGLQNGALVVGGLVTLGLAIVARVANAAPPAQDTRGEREALQSDLQMLNEQLSTKLAQLRTALMQVGEAVAGIAAQQQALAQTQGAPSAPAGHADDAVFRLAASLDKLHAHLDERVHALDLQVRSGFENVLAASHDVRRVLDQGGFAAPAASASDVHAFAPPAHAGHAAPGETGIAFYETMKKLDAISGETSDDSASLPGPGGHVPHPQAPFPSSQELDVMLPEEYRNRY